MENDFLVCVRHIRSGRFAMVSEEKGDKVTVRPFDSHGATQEQWRKGEFEIHTPTYGGTRRD